MNALLTVAEHKHGCEGQLPSNRSEGKSLEAGGQESIEVGKEGKIKGEEKREKTVLPPFEDKEEESWRKKRKIKCITRKSPPSSFQVVAGVLSNLVNCS